MTNEEKNKLIDEVLNEFDFEKVDSVMRYLGWKWAVWGDKRFIPGIYGLIKEATELMEQVLQYDDGEFHAIACGGFRATFDGVNLGLEFTVTSYETCEGGEEDDEECTDL